MKFNWGHGIAVFFTLFVIFMLSLLYLSRQENIDLVSDDYYADELVYQDRIDQLNNSSEAGIEVNHKLVNEQLVLSFPSAVKAAAVENGKIHFYRPSDASLDFVETLILDDSNQIKVNQSKLKAGYYVMKIGFSMEGKSYFIEKPIML